MAATTTTSSYDSDNPPPLLASIATTFIELCNITAPYVGILCFLAPLPTIYQISRSKTVGNYPLLPYSSMVCNCFIWIAYGLLKDLQNVWMSNGVGWFLGIFYCSIFRNNCNTATAVNLPGTIDMHYNTVVTIMTFNSMLIGLYGGNGAAEIIGKEGVIICIVLFASPLSALRNVILTKSAASIPLPFTLACMANCIAWSVVGLGLGHGNSNPDFNIYFPNLLGLSCTIAQLLLKAIYGNRSSVGLPRYEHLLNDHQ